jgi:DNA mismatch repair protein MutL
MPIEILQSEVIARIAAGEVIERPASVVKELIENSLDAGASQISIEIINGGIDYIRINDNGCGIAPDEIELAFQRHATSKIKTFEDMFALHSLGFRGEALPSIAAVSGLEISSRQADNEQAIYLKIENGKIINRGSAGRQPGTSITVRHLFRTVPARLKFLKSTAVETSHIAQITSQYALAYPKVKFSLDINGRASLHTPGNGKLLDTIIQVYGTEIASHMLDINTSGNLSDSDVKIDGMVGTPEISRSNTGYISLFVNHRWINNRRLIWAVEEAYHGLLMTGRHPIAIINIGIMPNVMDVNIHPTKSEVKFQDENAVFNTLQKAVRQTLLQTAPVPTISENIKTSYQPSPPQPSDYLRLTKPEDNSKLPLASKPPEFADTTTHAVLPILRVLGQLRNSYILAEGPDGLYIIDQHAAHERIQFERLSRQKTQHVLERQALLDPEILEVGPRQASLFQKYSAELSNFGFSIEPFGASSWIVRSIPAILTGKDWKSLLYDLLDYPISGNIDFLENLTALTACHSAIRFGQVLNGEEIHELVRQLEQISNPHSCPHGRPIMIRLTDEQLAREFKRT